MAMQVNFILKNSPMMEKLLSIPDLVAGNLCPTLPVCMNRIDVGSKVQYDSIVNDSAVLHLSYRVMKVEKGCIAWLDLENFKISQFA